MKIIITGAESTGKTELSEKLALHYGFGLEPEYAREYVSSLGTSPYTEEDVLKIAMHQKKCMEERKDEPFILDTWLIISKIWLRQVFNSSYQWIDDLIIENREVLYLLCSNDLPWIDDPLRENGGIMRDRLYLLYLNELKENNLNYRIVSGQGEQRFQNAIRCVDEYLKQNYD